jgi:hypothetical protein
MAQASRKRATAPRVPAFIWILAIVLAGAIAWRVAGRDGTASHHPTPRTDVTAQAAVVDAQRYAAAPDVARVYEMARAIPHIIDGIHCYCECARNFGHRSLLTCFETDHGAGCDVCMREVMIAYQLNERGESLQQIQAQIDALMGG